MGLIYGDDVLVAADGSIYLGSRELNVFSCMAMADRSVLDELNARRPDDLPLLIGPAVVLVSRGAMENYKIWRVKDCRVCETSAPWASSRADALLGSLNVLLGPTQPVICAPAVARERAEAWLANVVDNMPLIYESISGLKPMQARRQLALAFAIRMAGMRKELMEKIDAGYAAA